MKGARDMAHELLYRPHLPGKPGCQCSTLASQQLRVRVSLSLPPRLEIDLGSQLLILVYIDLVTLSFLIQGYANFVRIRRVKVAV